MPIEPTALLDLKSKPRILVFSTLFPNEKQPNAGLFIRERMFRVGEYLPIIVVSPVPWFPFQRVFRLFKPHFRPKVPPKETQKKIEVYHPPFFSVPGVLKTFDGLFLALSSYRQVKAIHKKSHIDVIDAHFAYPDGYAATLLGKWLGIPVTITLRGTEKRHIESSLRPQVLKALKNANRIFSVSNSLKQLMVERGADADKIHVVGNGVDLKRFHPLPKVQMREKLGIPLDATVLVTVGGLVERKGFHRVIECLPYLIEDFPRLKYLVVGGASAEGNWEKKLKKQVKDLDVAAHVVFFGAKLPDELSQILSASDLFVLSTRNEGWANVFLEAMACGLPVITTNVGGNAEVVNASDLGGIVPFGEKEKLKNGIHSALSKAWDTPRILRYAKENSWDKRISLLVNHFRLIHSKKIHYQ